MFVLYAIYPYTEGARFDADYYRDKHMPMCKRLIGPSCTAIGYSAGVAGGTPGSKPPFAAIGTLYFESRAAFEKDFPPQAAEIMADIPNYTDISPVVQIGEEVLLELAPETAARS